MRTLEQIALNMDEQDRRLVRYYLDHNQKSKAISFLIHHREFGPVMARGLVDFIGDAG